MIINSDQLKTFLVVCRTKNISRAAEDLHLTQSALSIRLQKLEETIGRTLMIRNKSGIVITESGQKLLKYAEILNDLEGEILGDLSPNKDRLTGTVRVGVFSSIGRSYVLPALEPLLREHPIDFHYQIKELRELPNLLQSGEADFIFLDRELKREGVKSILLGHERYVLAKGKLDVEEIYLNHDEEDMITYTYFEAHGKKEKDIKRRFVDEIYSVIDGVAAGVGLGILPEHLIKGDERIKIVNPSKFILSPVYLCFKDRPYRSELFNQVLKCLSTIPIRK